jgi:phage terminase Nu1 subunit (DNA packaging protein)
MTDEVDTAELARRFGCSTRQIRTLAQRGVVVRTAPGHYDAARPTTNYIRHLRAQAARHVGTHPAVDGVAANVKWKQASTALLEARFKREAAKLVDVAEARDMWGRIDRGTRRFVMGLPAKFAAAVPMTETDVRAIERLCRDGLEDAALERGYMTGSSGGERDDEVAA